MALDMALDVVGLEEDEQAVYEHVVSAGRTRLDELAGSLGGDTAWLRATLDALLRKGLLYRVNGEADEFAAAPPSIALEALLLAKEERIKRARLVAERLAGLHAQSASVGDPARFVEVIAGREVVVQRVRQMQRSCRDQVRVIDKPPYLGPVEPTFERELLDRGICWRTIYDTAGLESRHRLTGDVATVVRAGERARVLVDAPSKLMLLDDRMGLLPLQGADAGMDTAVVVYPSALLEALSALFEELWVRALPLRLPEEHSAGTCAPCNGASNDDLQLLNLLTAGLTDETIAKHLGVSHRTMQRRLRSLLDRLGVRTRFQGALRAAALGWIPTSGEVGHQNGTKTNAAPHAVLRSYNSMSA